MGYLHHRAECLIKGALAPNTSLTYQTALTAFHKFRCTHHLAITWPASVESVVTFIAYCFEQGLAPSTISTYVAGINYHHKLNSWIDISELFIVKKLLEGCKRSRKRSDKRAPITKQLLQQLCSCLHLVCYNQYETRLFTAAFTLAYFGLFRVSELVASDRSMVSRPLAASDISISDDKSSVTITLRSSKTNPIGPPTCIKLPSDDRHTICPVRATDQFLFVRPKNSGNLFCHANGSPVTRTQFAAVLNKAIKQSNLGISIFRTHSFRIGRATDLARAGVPTSAIMQLGRWQSNAYKTYIR